MQADLINNLLPQTQCTKCGYQGCLPYAQAIVSEDAAINRCPPGGDSGIAALATLLAKPVIPLDPSCGEHKPLQVAVIDEQYCIGCTLCIQACPVDAIIGANKFMHTVIAQDCTGCDLCVAPCPVDCIEMVTVSPIRQWSVWDANAARNRFEKRQARIAEMIATNIRTEAIVQSEATKAGETAAQHVTAENSSASPSDKHAAIAQALARARARRQIS